jgi:hypothetical protein
VHAQNPVWYSYCERGFPRKPVSSEGRSHRNPGFAVTPSNNKYPFIIMKDII